MAVVVATVMVAGCGGDGEDPVPTSAPPESTLTLTSAAFEAGEAIPAIHTCDGDGTSPPLEWSGVPDGTEQLALIVDDPDAPGGTFTHWVVWGIDAKSTGIDEGVAPAGATQGENDFGDSAYGGPCPPSGTHHYRFELLAISVAPDLEAGASANDLRRAVEGSVLGSTVLVGTYDG